MGGGEMNAPGAKRLREYLGLSDEQARLVRGLIRREVKTMDATLFPEANKHFAACYNPLPYTDRLMECLDEVVGSYGVEGLDDGSLYLNTGDTYSPTLLYSARSGTIRLTTWGDYVEGGMR
jgi:hypothetical protein